jgi:hypothetical protein
VVIVMYWRRGDIPRFLTFAVFAMIFWVKCAVSVVALCEAEWNIQPLSMFNTGREVKCDVLVAPR